MKEWFGQIPDHLIGNNKADENVAAPVVHHKKSIRFPAFPADLDCTIEDNGVHADTHNEENCVCSSSPVEGRGWEQPFLVHIYGRGSAVHDTHNAGAAWGLASEGLVCE